MADTIPESTQRMSPDQEEFLFRRTWVNAHDEAAFHKLAMEFLAVRVERDEARIKNQRLMDLLRHQRSELLVEELITQDEYAELAADHEAVARLEDYDAAKLRLMDERDAARAERDQALAEINIVKASALELLDVIRDKWACPPDMDAMTLYLASFVAGVADEWLRNPPPNGFTNTSKFANGLQLQIDIHRTEGKTAAESLKELHALAKELASALDSCYAFVRPARDGQEVADECLELFKRPEVAALLTEEPAKP